MSMSMSFDRARASPVAGRNEPKRSDANQRIFNFSIDGQRFTAIKSRLAVPKSKHAPTAILDQRQTERNAIGNITADSCQYIVFIDDEDVSSAERPSIDCLTSRELEISHLIADGKCDKEIARQLGISTYTVREHLRRIFSKLNVCRRSAVVSWILRGTG